MTSPIGADTSVAVPLLVSTHPDHQAVHRWALGRTLALSGHALAETYSVLTRLPGDVRLAPAEAARLIVERFAPPLMVSEDTGRSLAQRLARLGVAGGAVYDALIAFAALDNHTDLVTRDGRARPTYEALGVRVVVVG